MPADHVNAGGFCRCCGAVFPCARARPSRSIRVLIIPAAVAELCEVRYVEYRAAAMSDAIGGGLLGDIYYGNFAHTRLESGEPEGSCVRDGTGRFCLYADEDRVAKQLPANPRAAVLAARLGCIGELRGVPLTGDILVTGATVTNDDTDVPCNVLTAAQRGHLLPASAGSPAPRSASLNTWEDMR